MENIVRKLKELGYTISTMESCTGGGVADAITDIEGASSVIKFSAVTYCNEYKIKMGVDKKVIDKYSVYSMETAHEMSRNISIFADSDLGVGITGKLNRVDKKNPYGADNEVFISVYDRNNDKYYDKKIVAIESTRRKNKKLIIETVKELILEVI